MNKVLHADIQRKEKATLVVVTHLALIKGTADIQLSTRSNACWSAHILSAMDGLTKSYIFKLISAVLS